MASFWQLGNTSVRSAMRIKDGLTALASSPIQGNIRRGEGDAAFRRLLGATGVVSLGTDVSNSVGRKWRSAMGKLGFIYPDVQSSWGFTQEELGPLDIITPAGKNLVNSTTVAATQECFLRAMSVPVVEMNDGKTFSPLRWTLALLLSIEQKGYLPAVSFVEMALWVQTTTPNDGLELVVDKILSFRKKRENADSKRRFDKDFYERESSAMGCKPHTFIDYADMNIRYLKATGMVQAQGKGITIVPSKRAMAQELAKELDSNSPLLPLYQSLCNSAPLPTDNLDIAHSVLQDLSKQVAEMGIDYSVKEQDLSTPAKVNQVRFEIEELISEQKEEIYAQQQSAQWQEIATYMDLIATRKDRVRLNDDVEISIPRTEKSAYLEWVLWRAFLAIDSLVNKPYEVRRFNIDQDFLPVSTAPGNGPDLIAEFETFVIVIEVTLSESSRQEAMEGEPVRRHVADLALSYDKPVYGLFVANKIDSNTAETFRIGVWYTSDDEKLNLHIVPFTLLQFSSFFKSLFENNNASPQKVIDLMRKCEQHRKSCDAPEWKKQINAEVDAVLRSPILA